MVDEIQLKAAYEKGFRIGFAEALLTRMMRLAGQAPAELATRTKRLNLETLEDLSDALLDFDTYNDVDRWLRRVEEKKRMAQAAPVDRAYERGLCQALHRSLLRRITRSFSEISPNLPTALQRQNSATLDALDLALPDLLDDADVERWLADVEETKWIEEMAPIGTPRRSTLRLESQHLLLRRMTRRFGQVPSAISSRLQSLSADVLDELDLALPDLHTYADVEQWLAQQS